MFCTKCGAKLEEGASFCIQCGNPVGSRVTQEKHVHANQITIQPVSTELDAGGPDDGDGPRRPKWLLGLIIGLCILLACVLGVGGYLLSGGLFGGSYQEREADEEDEEEEDEEKKEDGETQPEEGETAAEEPAEKDQLPVHINVRQVDNSNFPKITFYASITDQEGNVVEGLAKEDFKITEIMQDGSLQEVEISDVEKILGQDKINVNLVLDASGSMSDYDKMEQAQSAADSFINQVNLSSGDKVEIISFDDFVYLDQDFTSNINDLTNALYSISPGGMTALYDALYAGVLQSYYEEGAKCVIAFTDGLENASSYSFDEVVNLSQNTGIPVFIVGIGEEYDADELERLAKQCSGNYYSSNAEDLQTILEDIYLSIYREQQDYYVFEYTSPNTELTGEFRNIKLETSDIADFTGSYTKEYIPVADLSGGFSASYMNKDFMIEDSSGRQLTEDDLKSMSLAELRIARNEIFARHGRQFKDSMLNKWFYSKTWYLNIPDKYTPDDFDRISPSPLSELEIENTEFIKAYEQQKMENEDIFPNADSILLSDYDLCLSKPILKKALEQMLHYKSTNILEQNKILVQKEAEKEDVQY